MLRINGSRSSQAATAYFVGDRHGYFSEDRERIGTWGGKLAKMLALSGHVTPEAFAALAENKHPHTGQRLTPRTKTSRTCGYDFNFHCPKSVSIMHGIVKDERILKAFEEAVEATMQELEKDAQTRIRKDGVDANRVTKNLAWARYTHFTARPVNGMPDPHLHAHCFTFNATHDSVENRTKAGQFRDLKRDAPYYEGIFHAKLASKLQELGYAVVRSGKSFELAGVPDSLNEEFSRRTAHIERVAEKLGITSDVSKSKLGAVTREAKRKDLSPAELHRSWVERIEPQTMKNLKELLPHERGKEHVFRDGHAEMRAIEYACQHSFERASVIDERRLIETALRYGVANVDIAKLQEVAATHPRLIRQVVDGRSMVTTPDVLKEEQQLVAWVREGRKKEPPLAYGHVIRDKRMTDEQRSAVRHILESTDRVTGVEGRAGTGKTTLMREAIDAMKAHGHRVTVLAPTAEAARGLLRGEGFADAETVQQLLCNEELQEKARGGVLWIDEANLLSVRDMKRVTELAERIDARLVLSGDVRQHRSVERGDSLQVLIDHADLRLAQVGTIRRQSGAYREAVEHFASGQMDKGFAKLDSIGAICEIAHEERYKQLAAEYLEVIRKGKTALVISPTHAECRQVTEVIREELKASSHLHDAQSIPVLRRIDFTKAELREHTNYRRGWVLELVKSVPGHQAGSRLIVSQVADGRVYVEKGEFADHVFDIGKYADRFNVYEPTTLEVGIGENIRITKNGKSADGDHRLYNGSLQKVVGFTDTGDIRLESGRVISRQYAHIDYGYTTTSHSAQGKTVDYVFIAESSDSFAAASMEQFYVSVSRGRQLVRIYTNDRAALLEAVQSSSRRLAAMDIIPLAHPTDHDEEIHQAQHRADREPTLQAEPSREWLGQMPNVPKKNQEHFREEIIKREREMAMGR